VSAHKLIDVVSDPRMQGPLAWPFKVLRDVFRNPPFVADPEFSPFQVDILKRKPANFGPLAARPRALRIDQAHLVFLLWLIQLLLVIAGLIIVT
jgi:hypothetical protein